MDVAGKLPIHSSSPPPISSSKGGAAQPEHVDKSVPNFWSGVGDHWRTIVRLLLLIGLTYRLQWRLMSQPLCAGSLQSKAIDGPFSCAVASADDLLDLFLRSGNDDGTNVEGVTTSAAATRSGPLAQCFERLKKSSSILLSLFSLVFLFLENCKPWSQISTWDGVCLVTFAVCALFVGFLVMLAHRRDSRQQNGHEAHDSEKS
ncbi:hypothetical protein IE81DRAFT_326530 [Ceraceosorus guamensis]|uniref:Transmembrane protein n=1 Tax=Ceraceosorus guamensis TaxID=1522189 RepID=A0A316VQY1_9BASI|nr:hypothetical protein IE81DRAFT_326530 [Ceraceosorus guamensis]PWN39458.1 hypothetical protein IE81DRAFT_326530 [Ceraceosorus guamensis]